MDNQYLFNYSIIAKEDQFIGRTTEKEFLLKRINKGFKFSLFGQRRIGKTSMAFEIQRILETDNIEKERLFGIDVKYKVIYCDCGTVFYENDIWRKILNGLDPKYDVSNFDKIDIFKLETMLLSGEEQILFIWDEFEIMARNKNITQKFYNFFRGIANTNPKVNFLTISKSSIFDIGNLYDHLIGSPFFNIFTNYNLKGLSDIESKKLLTLGLGDNKEINDSINKLVEYAGNSPYYLTLIGDICTQYNNINDSLYKIQNEFYISCKPLYEEILREYDLYYYTPIFNAIFDNGFIPEGILKRKLIEENIILSEDNIKCTSKALEQYIKENINK